MGIGWIYFRHLDQRGVFRAGPLRVLDVGAQYLLDLPREEGFAFLRRHGSPLDDVRLRAHVECLSARSVWPLTPERAPLYLAEFLRGSAIDYQSIDIFEAPDCRIFDLNYHNLPDADRESFQVVLNFGTSEHVFNQFNCFKVMHEATRPGGYIYHQVPCSGYLDHGYWVYSPRAFVDLAEANDYELLALWCSGPQGQFRLGDRVNYHPTVRDTGLPENNFPGWQAMTLTDGLVNVLYRKRASRPFALGLDMTTSNGGLPADVLDNYLGENRDNAQVKTQVKSLTLKPFSSRLLFSELVQRVGRRVLRCLGLSK